jgi:hypothetical protein
MGRGVRRSLLHHTSVRSYSDFITSSGSDGGSGGVSEKVICH